ncbi:MAG: N-acetylneuraminate synthase [Nitrospira sp.]|nr:N-acetylneuraminate synthase [Nitrospira sp.]
MKSSCFIIAEAGVNHNGSEEMALQLIEAAAAAGADAVKFQTFRSETLCLPGTSKAEYQKAHTGTGDQFAMLKTLELSWASYPALIARCRSLGIEFMSTAFDEEALDMLVGLGMMRIKIPSGEITNLPLLRYAATKRLPIILSTGMASLDEVKEAIMVVCAAVRLTGVDDLSGGRIALLHCTSNYPTAMADVNLRAMQTLRQETGLPVGYSDHTQGTLIAPVAVALGATIIEKHLTLDRNLPGPDHHTSLTPDEFAIMVKDIRAVEEALGDGIKAPRPAELPVRALVRRSIVLRHTISEGQRLSRNDLTLLRPGVGIEPRYLDIVVGRRVVRTLPAGTVLTWEDLES